MDVDMNDFSMNSSGQSPVNLPAESEINSFKDFECRIPPVPLSSDSVEASPASTGTSSSVYVPPMAKAKNMNFRPIHVAPLPYQPVENSPLSVDDHDEDEIFEKTSRRGRTKKQHDTKSNYQSRSLAKKLEEVVVSNENFEKKPRRRPQKLNGPEINDASANAHCSNDDIASKKKRGHKRKLDDVSSTLEPAPTQDVQDAPNIEIQKQKRGRKKSKLLENKPLAGAELLEENFILK